MFRGLAQQKITYTAVPWNYKVAGSNAVASVDAQITRSGTYDNFLI
jgi:hypothetical protein